MPKRSMQDKTEFARVYRACEQLRGRSEVPDLEIDRAYHRYIKKVTDG